MQPFSGVIFHNTGGFASAGFYGPSNKVVGWAWKSYLLIGGIFSWIIIPFITAYFTLAAVEITGNAGSSVLSRTCLKGGM